nr:hypothetical protein Iba_scaffold47250CG0210 [Ipomoea batatas]
MRKMSSITKEKVIKNHFTPPVSLPRSWRGYLLDCALLHDCGGDRVGFSFLATILTTIVAGFVAASFWFSATNFTMTVAKLLGLPC